MAVAEGAVSSFSSPWSTNVSSGVMSFSATVGPVHVSSVVHFMAWCR